MDEPCFWTDLVNATQTCVKTEEEEMKYLACFDGIYAYEDDGIIVFEVGGGCTANPFVVACDPEMLGRVLYIGTDQWSLVDSVVYSLPWATTDGLSMPSSSGYLYSQPRTESQDIAADGYVLRPGSVTYAHFDNTSFNVSFPRPEGYVNGDQPYFYIRLKFTHPDIDGFVYYSSHQRIWMS